MRLESSAQKRQEAVFDWAAFTRLKQLKHLLRTGQIDAEFFWR